MNEQEMEAICDEMKDLLKKKNRTYGDKNITRIGQTGILTRLEEKIERLKNMLANKIIDAESAEDTWKDIAGYAIIGLMLERGKWENK
ncbi:DUF1599 domain-containing protein [Candidatus Pacearchaeota archaeon]|nr:DUF1599 domain-containing protein [Candidatus Pacearchaeota archaeon]